MMDLPCEVCQKPSPSDACHIRSRGAGGGDELFNLMSLCRREHQEQHSIGIKSFVKKYSLSVSWESGWPRRTDRE